jgi:hypothetical protein
MKNSLKTVRFVFLAAALTGAIWLPSRDAAADGTCRFWCDNDTTVTYTSAASEGHCRQAAYNTCIPRGVGGTYCYSEFYYDPGCESW